jgi:tellurite methyltransferase
MRLSSVHPPVKIVKKLTKLVKSGSVLDIGAGRGRHAIYLAQKGFDVTALEPNEEYVNKLNLKASQRDLKIETIAQDLLGYKPEKLFNVVVAISVLHFLSNKKEVDGAIEKMQAWTKNKGLQVISVMMSIESSDPRPYLFNKNELKGYYKDWDILFYEELRGGFYTPTKSSEPVRNWVARLIARKPE